MTLTAAAPGDTASTIVTTPAAGSTGVVHRSIDVLRIGIGLVFLWAFVDKLFGFSYSTGPARSWLSGGSPTEGFLGHVQVGPGQSAFRAIAGQPWVDWLFMLALLGVGLAMVLGVALRPAALAGSLLMVLMWAAEWPLARFDSAGAATGSPNPLIDYHLIYALALWAVAALGVGSAMGLSRRWNRLPMVRRFAWLR